MFLCFCLSPLFGSRQCLFLANSTSSMMADIYETTCPICLSPLACWPHSDDLASSNLSLTLLLCGHYFHSDCILASGLQWHAGREEPVASPLVSRSCPLCRCFWTPDPATEQILGDFECANCLDEDSSSDEGSDEGSDEEPDGGNVSIAAVGEAWSQFIDPESSLVFWTKEDETDAFWEISPAPWERYQTPAGEFWYSNSEDTNRWFYEDSGARGG